jgi:hypothetical protein
MGRSGLGPPLFADFAPPESDAVAAARYQADLADWAAAFVTSGL